MKILKIFGIIVIVAVVLFLIVGLLLPSTAYVERSITINASPGAIFEEVNNTRNLNNWSPWARIDPDTEYSFDGPESGVGAKMSWSSEHEQVGQGSQWIIESVENEKVTNQLEFDGFEGDFKASIILEPTGDQTNVTWTYDADMGNMIGKFFGLFMDGMLGPFYEKGLANLKEVSESKPAYGVEITEEEVSAMNYVGHKQYVKWEELESLGEKIGAAYGRISDFMDKNNIEPDGMPFAIYSNWEEEVGFDMECGLPVAEETTVRDRNLTSGQTHSGMAVKAVHMGAYEAMEPTYNALMKYFEDKGYTEFNSSWEVYVTDPMDEPDTAKWVTHVYVALN